MRTCRRTIRCARWTAGNVVLFVLVTLIVYPLTRALYVSTSWPLSRS